MEKVQPHCMVCREPFKKDDLVQTDKLFNQFTHFYCYDLHKTDIKEIGKYGDVVATNKNYKVMYNVQ